MVNVVLRLIALPFSVLLSAMGSAAPNPLKVNRLAAMSRLTR